MSSTNLERMAKVVIQLYEQTSVTKIKIRDARGNYIELDRQEYGRTIKEDFLTQLSPELERKRRGAWQTLEGSTSDRHAQAVASMREVLRCLLDMLAPDEQVRKARWYEKPKQGNPVTRAMRVRFAIAGDSTEVSKSTLEHIDVLAEAVEAMYAKLSAQEHGGKAGEDRITRAYLRACESVIELIVANREHGVLA